MAIEICPLEVDWGNVADWAAVAVAFASAGIAAVAAVIALGGTVAVGYLGWQANSLVNKSDVDAAHASTREGDLMTILFEPELHLFAVGMAGVLHLLQQGESYADSREKRDQVASQLQALALPEISANFERLHVLPSQFGYGISRLKGRFSALQVVAESARGSSGNDARLFGEMILESGRALIDSSKEIAQIAEARRTTIFDGKG